MDRGRLARNAPLGAQLIAAFALRAQCGRAARDPSKNGNSLTLVMAIRYYPFGLYQAFSLTTTPKEPVPRSFLPQTSEVFH